MKLEHLIIAKESSIDTDRNSLSVFDFIEDITIRRGISRIVLPVQLILVLRREIEVGDIERDLTISVRGPSNEPILNLPVHYKLATHHKRTRMRVNLELPIAFAGNYSFSVQGTDFSGEYSIGVTLESAVADVN